MDDFDLYQYVEDVTKDLPPLDDDQMRNEDSDVVFFDYFQPFRRPYSNTEAKEKYHVEAEARGEVYNFNNFYVISKCISQE